MRRKGGLGMSEWKKVKLGEVCDTQYGFTASTVQQDTGTQFLRITDIVPQLIDWNTVPYCQIQEKDREKYLLHKGDIVVARTGATVGYAKYIKEDVPAVFASYLVRLLVNSIDVDRHYVGLCVESNLFKEYIQSISNGSAQPNANAQMISSFEINLPPLSTQHRIATILSRYDSLIENYQKQIKLLEEAAQRLYKEWFIDLHFPGHENTKIVDGVPEGWEKKKAFDFFEMSIGKTPPRTQKQWFTECNNGIPWVSISDMKDAMFIQNTSEELTLEACEKFNVKIVPKGTILLSFKLTIGRVAFAGADVCTNEAIAHFQKEGDEWKAYTLMYLRNYNYDSLGNTSGISKAVNSTIIKNMPFVMPCIPILQEYSQRVLPIIKQIESLQSQIRLLTEARDRLLPKLMSGEITV